MKDTDKALYYCHTHPNLFLQQHCKVCRKGMCRTCIDYNSTTCTECLRESYIGSKTYAYKKELAWMMVSGIFTLALFFTYTYVSNIDIYDSSLDYLLVFLFGLSITGTHYLLRDTDFMGDIRKVPFIGFKLSIIVLLLIFVTGIPIIYFLYKLLILIIKSIQGNH